MLESAFQSGIRRPFAQFVGSPWSVLRLVLAGTQARDQRSRRPREERKSRGKGPRARTSRERERETAQRNRE